MHPWFYAHFSMAEYHLATWWTCVIHHSKHLDQFIHLLITLERSIGDSVVNYFLVRLSNNKACECHVLTLEPVLCVHKQERLQKLFPLSLPA